MNTPITSPALSRLLTNIRPYYRKAEVDSEILKCDAKTRRKWEGFLIELDCQYGDWFQPFGNLNFYQAACLSFIADYKYQFPGIRDTQLIDLIAENQPQFQLEYVMSLTSSLNPEKSTEIVHLS